MHITVDNYVCCYEYKVFCLKRDQAAVGRDVCKLSFRNNNKKLNIQGGIDKCFNSYSEFECNTPIGDVQ